MDDFYKNIVNITENSKKPVPPASDVEHDKHIKESTQKTLHSFTDEIIKMLTVGYKLNINTAASNGLNSAYIAVIGINAKYAGVINIMNMIFPNEELLKKHREFGCETVMERITALMHPFTVKCEQINETTFALKVYW